ncbi:hypothetical protein TVAG_332350, partial [Trichomonas vaginalis G3]
MTTTENTTTAIVHEDINEEYEYIQYNKQLRLIRSVKDDMYQMQSILTACFAPDTKKPQDWFELNSTHELLSEFEHVELKKMYQDRQNLPSHLKGIYVHKFLVSSIAMWASPRYAIYILMLLDELCTKQREDMMKEDKSLQKRIPRSVPKGKEKNYKYMIYTEEMEKEEDRDM